MVWKHLGVPRRASPSLALFDLRSETQSSITQENTDTPFFQNASGQQIYRIAGLRNATQNRFNTNKLSVNCILRPHARGKGLVGAEREFTLQPPGSVGGLSLLKKCKSGKQLRFVPDANVEGPLRVAKYFPPQHLVEQSCPTSMQWGFEEVIAKGISLKWCDRYRETKVEGGGRANNKSD